MFNSDPLTNCKASMKIFKNSNVIIYVTCVYFVSYQYCGYWIVLNSLINPKTIAANRENPTLTRELMYSTGATYQLCGKQKAGR